jgi:hypothetical protein
LEFCTATRFVSDDNAVWIRSDLRNKTIGRELIDQPLPRAEAAGTAQGFDLIRS